MLQKIKFYFYYIFFIDSSEIICSFSISKEHNKKIISKLQSYAQNSLHYHCTDLFWDIYYILINQNFENYMTRKLYAAHGIILTPKVHQRINALFNVIA